MINLEKRKVYAKAYYIRNKDRIYKRTKAWAKAHPENIRRAWKKWEQSHKMNRREKTLRKYNLTLEDYFTRLELQGFVCRICGRAEESKKNTYLTVDHDHLTGKVRGLLCDKCNRGLGHFEDSKELLLSAYKYLSYAKYA